ncbi:hypothetical protein GF323_00840, partial [Candidatus Woesearchaeota archaeon]|nr:hypothetical protein [Candidatus Woesearchaeota archaeon]
MDFSRHDFRVISIILILLFVLFGISDFAEDSTGRKVLKLKPLDTFLTSGDDAFSEITGMAPGIMDAGLPSGPIAHWKFENNLNDETGNNDGSCTNCPTYANGQQGQAA